MTTTVKCGSETEKEIAIVTETVTVIGAMSVIATVVAGAVHRVLTLLGTATGSTATATGTATSEGSEKTDIAMTGIATTCAPLVRLLTLVIAAGALLLPDHVAATTARRSRALAPRRSRRAVRLDQGRLRALRPLPSHMLLCRRRKTTLPT